MNDEETIFKKIKRLEDDLRGYKTAQPVGTDSVITYEIQTNNIWDVDTALPANTLGFGNASYDEYEVHFRARDQIAPFASMRVFAESPITLYYMTPAFTLATMTQMVVSVAESYSYLNPEAAADPQLYRYTVRVQGPQYTAYKLKMAMSSTDQGRMTIYKVTSNGLQVVVA